MSDRKMKKDGVFVKGNLRIPFQIVRSSRKTMAIQIRADGQVMVRIPLRMSWAAGEVFLQREEEWVESHYLSALRTYEPPRVYTEEEIRSGKEKARRVLTERTEQYSRQMGVSFGTITIRQQKSRWGSCSAAGNLNYNWKLILMPEEILDYVVVHELAHRLEMNHSKRFWKAVEGILPDYQERRKWLRIHGREY